MAPLAQNVLVTGSNRGIGLELVRQLVENAVSLASVRAAVKEVESQLNGKGLNLLINNAAVNSHATLQSVQPEEMISVFTTNVVGPIQVAKEFLPLLKRAAEEAGKEGLNCSKAAIINMSTKVGSIELCFKVLEIPMYPYRASKVSCVPHSASESLRTPGRASGHTALCRAWVEGTSRAGSRLFAAPSNKNFGCPPRAFFFGFYTCLHFAVLF
uniref:Uncharacterized protein n=1 Tax=Terrapene triunguis TaxID=2587831 RepID=A0A674J1M8_9SAUR